MMMMMMMMMRIIIIIVIIVIMFIITMGFLKDALFFEVFQFLLKRPQCKATGGVCLVVVCFRLLEHAARQANSSLCCRIV